ncbi:MAG: septum formation inhibitor Maf [Deltaproteobacteria bacterium]|nr:septum formation inhibitor Maf [Deltaproteobacteria bacterium]
MAEYNTANPGLILASASPRRRDLLTQAGLPFTVIPSTVDETALTAGPPEVQVRMLAQAKAKQVAARFPDHWVIGADTLVVIDGRVLGKPKDRTEARAMLHRLSGRTHTVWTGYCLCCKDVAQSICDAVDTKVQFKTLSAGEIAWYVNTSEPYDKAGGYAAQGLGSTLIKRIEGSYTNVVGLPVCEVVETLVRVGVVRRSSP